MNLFINVFVDAFTFFCVELFTANTTKWIFFKNKIISINECAITLLLNGFYGIRAFDTNERLIKLS
jgi:hypothetical protein